MNPHRTQTLLEMAERIPLIEQVELTPVLPPPLPKDDAELRARVEGLCEWAASRINHCRRQEAKFADGDVAIEAASERRALQAILMMMGAR